MQDLNMTCLVAAMPVGSGPCAGDPSRSCLQEDAGTRHDGADGDGANFRHRFSTICLQRHHKRPPQKATIVTDGRSFLVRRLSSWPKSKGKYYNRTFSSIMILS